MATPKKSFIKPNGIFAPSHIAGPIKRDGPVAYADAIVSISTEVDLDPGSDYELTSSILWDGKVVWTSTTAIVGSNETVQQTARLPQARLWEVSAPAKDGQHIEAALYTIATTLLQHGASVDRMQVMHCTLSGMQELIAQVIVLGFIAPWFFQCIYMCVFIYVFIFIFIFVYMCVYSSIGPV